MNYDNSDNVLKIANLRLEIAKMLGFSNFAEMILGDRMADTPEKVESFLEELYLASKPAAFRDFENIRNFADDCGHTDQLLKDGTGHIIPKNLRKNYMILMMKYLNHILVLKMLKMQYFGLATSLYGIRFSRNNTIPVYHPEVKTYEVYDQDDSFLAVLYIDYHPRPGKNGGAWMTSYRDQRNDQWDQISDH